MPATTARLPAGASLETRAPDVERHRRRAHGVDEHDAVVAGVGDDERARRAATVEAARLAEALDRHRPQVRAAPDAHEPVERVGDVQRAVRAQRDAERVLQPRAARRRRRRRPRRTARRRRACPPRTSRRRTTRSALASASTNARSPSAVCARPLGCASTRLAAPGPSTSVLPARARERPAARRRRRSPTAGGAPPRRSRRGRASARRPTATRGGR